MRPHRGGLRFKMATFLPNFFCRRLLVLILAEVPFFAAGAKLPWSSNSPIWCTFEEGTMCGWHATSAAVKWTLNDPTKKIPDFPRFDHTLRAYSGRFIFALSNSSDAATASLESPDLDVNANNSACLSLWLFTFHAMHNKLAVYAAGESVFNTSARVSHRWEHVLVDFKRSSGKFKILIQTYFARGLVALDDIQVYSGRCAMIDFCSWEEDSPCLLIHDPRSFSLWQPRRASLFGFPDHTLKNLQGHYLYLNTTAVDSHHPVSRVFLQKRPSTEATCVTFWFSGRGHSGQLNVYRFTKETVLGNPLFSASVSTPKRPGGWIARTVTVSSRSDWHLVFEGVAAKAVRHDSGIMVDDLEFADGECPPYNLCTFENECLPLEIPTQESANVPAFEVERAGSFDKLPEDHTMKTGDGYYLLFRSRGIKSRPISMVLREPLRYKCLSFWYFLPAVFNGVTVFGDIESVPKTGGVWKRYQVDMPFPEPISASSGKNADGFAAIDDVLVSEERCGDVEPMTETHCGKGHYVRNDRVCDFVTDCDGGADERDCGECDFSKDACGWNLYGIFNVHPTDWRRVPVGNVSTLAPTLAGGLSKGYYLVLYFNVTASETLSHAVIDSPRIRNTSKLCTLRFSYNYVGNGTDVDVDLYMKIAGYPRPFPVWTLRAASEIPEEGVWNEAIVEVGRYSRAVMFKLEGRQKSKGQSMIAVDAIKYQGCALSATYENCSNLNFHCANGACVRLDARCDYVDDCGDNSDEHGCGDYGLGCNFDSSFCDWVPQAPPEGTTQMWMLAWPSSSLAFGPTRDHTNGNPEGKLLLLRSDSTKTAATVIGHTLDNKETCSISFFYIIQGTANSQLKLAIRTAKDGAWKTKWQKSEPTEFFHFIQAIVDFSEETPYQVAFIGEHRLPGKQGYIAIDDVSFRDSCKIYYDKLPLAPVPTSPSSLCGEKEFECSGSRQCIPLSKVCDFKEDCSNGADESTCATAVPATSASAWPTMRSFTPGAEITSTAELPLAPVPTSPLSLCGEKEFECSGSRQCIPLSKVCDFKEDCSNGADESTCATAEPATSASAWPTTRSFTPGAEVTSTAERSSTLFVATITVAVFVAVFLAVMLTDVFVRRRRVAKDSAAFFSNPSYDASTEDTTIPTIMQWNGIQLKQGSSTDGQDLVKNPGEL
ncbi:MAM and LDL-receptor class A domain-containing protein 1-like [Amblyomma americanum]